MYVGIDVGGTKTLVAVLDKNGVIEEQSKFPTPTSYDEFQHAIKNTIGTFKITEFHSGGIGIPSTVFDRDHERAISFGNLPWHNVSVQHDMEQICQCPMAVENDAKLAGLSEAMMVKDEFNKVLYITISTGIGFSVINHQIIDTNFGDGGGHSMLVSHKGKLVPWENFASGHAIVERFGKKAYEITDETTWEIIARDFAVGIIDLIAVTEPEIIIIGGSVGTYFERYGRLLKKDLKNYKLPLIKIPTLRGALRPELAVIYGCYDLTKQVYGHAKIIS